MAKAKTKTKKLKRDARPPAEIFPTVSVILTSYNHAEYISAAIESVLNQTFTDFELLIVDDGSRDNSREIIKTFNDERIKTFLYEENRGTVIAIRDAMSCARGKYIAVHHSDDLWTPEKLARQVEFLEANPDYAACFTWADFVDEAGNVHELAADDFYRNIFDQPNRSRAEWLNYFFHNANCLCHPSAMLRREAYDKFHLLEVHGFWQLPDLLMWVRLCFHAEIFILPERLTQFRLRRTRQENTSATSADKLIRADLEFFFMAQEFVYNFTDNKFFLEVFPEAEKFLVGGQINRRFAFAQLCLEKKIAAFELAGLMILKNLLNSPENAAQIFELYDYDDKSFLRDGGGYDVFNLEQKFSMLHAEIFAGTDDFTRIAEKIISVETGGKFYGRIELELKKFVKYLRFDPDKKFISVKLNNVLINGEPGEIISVNANEIRDGFYKFLTNDPQFVFKCETSGHVTFEVFGEREGDFSSDVMLTIKKFIAEKNFYIKQAEEISKRNDEILERNEEISKRNEEILEQSRKVSEHNDNLRQLNAELQQHNEELQERNAKLHSWNEDLYRWNDEVRKQSEDYKRQGEELQRQIAELKRQHAEQIAELQRQIDALNLHNANLHAENQRLTQFNAELLNSNSWRMTEPLRALRRWINYGGRDKVLSAGRLLYRAVPISEGTKTELKDKFYMRFGSLLEGTERYKNWQMSRGAMFTAESMPLAPPTEENFFEEELFSQPGKIAIQAHIFYLDLLDEMAAYCANMPYKFDALISIVDESAADKVAAAFEKIPNAEEIIVRVVPNRGRDVAPFLAGFGDLLPTYDFIAHIHSKKSLYTGSEQQNWRNYLFDALLGTQERIRKIFRAFADDKSVGVIYPRPAENVPYAAFTWMSNRAVGMQLLRSAGIKPNRTEYFDFPAGTMFWARSRALRKFFALGLTFEDFPPEQGQNDGTIAHAFERSILLAAQSEGMNYYEFEPATFTYSRNLGCKNLWQYLDTRNGITPELDWLLNQGEIVTFDIFDTLIMRYVAAPALVNEIIQLKLEERGINLDFPTLRIKAEELARQKKFADVTLDEIYQSFAELAKLDVDTCKKIRELEVSTEVQLILPREDVVAWFKEILLRGRKVWLVSDMYMQTPDLERLLAKCAVTGYEKLLISCETGMRKDTAAIWNDFASRGLNLVHVGDNEMSDVQLPGDRKFGIYHLMSAVNLFSQVPFGRAVLEHFGGKFSLYAGICLGVVLAKKFQSPFRLQSALTDGTHRLILRNFHELGYWLYGAPLLTFMLWLIKKSRADGVERILFLARDGYFLRPLYEFITNILNVKPLPSDYFYASRRAVTVASIRDISQAKELIKLRFDGTTEQFFRARFGLDLGDDERIILPNEFSTTDCERVVEKIIDEHAEEILRHAELERANFTKYISDLGGSLERCGVVDMGYSGTIQFYLQELTGKIFTGYYFATSATNRFGESASERMRGCFTENDDYGKTTSAVYRYQLLFETILTAPDAQLKNFDANGKPVFGEPEPGQLHFAELNAIHEGVKDFCRDVAEVFGDILLRVPLDKDFVDVWIRAFMSDDKLVPTELREIFTLDDDYCNTFHGNAFEFYRRGLDRPNPLLT